MKLSAFGMNILFLEFSEILYYILLSSIKFFYIKKRIKVILCIKTYMKFFSKQQHTSILFQFTSYKIGVRRWVVVSAECVAQTTEQAERDWTLLDQL